jgi:hypothetical protein
LEPNRIVTTQLPVRRRVIDQPLQVPPPPTHRHTTTMVDANHVKDVRFVKRTDFEQGIGRNHIPIERRHHVRTSDQMNTNTAQQENRVDPVDDGRPKMTDKHILPNEPTKAKSPSTNRNPRFRFTLGDLCGVKPNQSEFDKRQSSTHTKSDSVAPRVDDPFESSSLRSPDKPMPPHLSSFMYDCLIESPRDGTMLDGKIQNDYCPVASHPFGGTSNFNGRTQCLENHQISRRITLEGNTEMPETGLDGAELSNITKTTSPHFSLYHMNTAPTPTSNAMATNTVVDLTDETTFPSDDFVARDVATQTKHVVHPPPKSSIGPAKVKRYRFGNISTANSSKKRLKTSQTAVHSENRKQRHNPSSQNDPSQTTLSRFYSNS